MGSSTIRARSLLCALPLLVLPSAAQKPDYAVPAGTRFERTVELTQYLEQASADATVDGVSRPAPMKIEFATKLDLRVRDEVRAQEGGRPTEVQRRFEDIGGSAVLRTVLGENEGNVDVTAESPLEGISVVYTWVPEEDDWGRYFDEEEADEGHLAELAQDMDALAFRPGPDVQPGAIWKVPASELANLIAPCGNLALSFDVQKVGPLVRPLHAGLGARPHLSFDGSVEGEVQARWQGLRQVRGKSFAVVGIDFELRNISDRTESYRSNLTFEEFRSGMRVHDAQTQWSARGKGELLFSQDGGYLAEVSIDAEQAHSLRWSGDLPVGPGKTVSIQENMSFVGTLDLSVKTRKLE